MKKAGMIILMIMVLTLNKIQATDYVVQEFPICTQSDNQQDSDIFGNTVVWADSRNGNGDDIYGYDLLAKQEFAICTATVGQCEPAIDGNIVVWVDFRSNNGDIYGYDLVSKQEFTICTAALGQIAPDIYGNNVVWTDWRNGGIDIYGYDLLAKQEFAICTATGQQSGAKIYGNTVVWQDLRNSGYSHIYGYDLITKQEFPICTAGGWKGSPAIHGNTVVWAEERNGGWDIYGCDLVTKQEFPICTAFGDQDCPRIYNNTVVWHDNRNGNNDIYGYDIVTAQEFPICTAAGDQLCPAIFGNTVVWTDNRNGNSDIYMAILQPRRLCQEQISGDLNGDCKVDFEDFAIMASHWLQRSSGSITKFALNINPNWTTEGEWQFGTPMGMGGLSHGYPDPIAGNTGLSVYGVNLDGDYTVAVGGPYQLTAGPFDCSGYESVELNFARWLNTDTSVYVKCMVEVSNDGSNWQEIWGNPADTEIADTQWQQQHFNISSIADRQATVYVRWSYQILNDHAYPYSGWNIDDVELRGLLN